MAEFNRTKLPPCVVDLTGRRCGNVVVVEYAGSHPARRGSMWRCRCDCGEMLIASAMTIRTGHIEYCKTCRSRHLSEVRTKHGRTHTREFRVWVAMRKRADEHPRYKDRGIKVCRRWQESFTSFYADMGQCLPGQTIERKNNDGDYSPSNCRWASRREQAQNRSTNVLITFDGRTQTQRQWCAEIGLPEHVAIRRRQAGWPIEMVLNSKLTRGQSVSYAIRRRNNGFK